MTDEVEKFTSAGDKIISHELNQILWCNQMDMLALVTKGNLLEVCPFHDYYSNFDLLRCSELVIKIKRYSRSRKVLR